MIPTTEQMRAGVTLAELQGLTEELGAAIASIGAREAALGDPEVARAILEGLVVTNPKDAMAWALLSQLERRRGEPWRALLCAQAAFRLAPGDRQVRLARAEALLAIPADAGTGRAKRVETARAVLGDLASGPDEVARRSGALLRALGA